MKCQGIVDSVFLIIDYRAAGILHSIERLYVAGKCCFSKIWRKNCVFLSSSDVV